MIKQVIVIRKDLNMRKGKMCAQAAHASMKVLLNRMSYEMGDDEIFSLKTNKEIREWFHGSFTKVVVGCEDYLELVLLEEKATDAGIINAAIMDNGVTEFHGEPKLTALAIGPAEVEEIDKITGHLKLL